MIGELAALTAALLWAVASIIFADIGIHIRAINLNLIKGLLACVIMVVVLWGGTLVGTSGTNLGSIANIPQMNLCLLLLSGVIGIGIGDTAYFGCLRRIGPQKGLMLESSAPLMAAILALLLFNENLRSASWAGVVITTFGIILVVRLSQSQMHYQNSFSGISLGLLAASAQAAGIVLSRMALAGGEVDPLASSLLRLGAGLAALGCWLCFRKIFPAGDGKNNQSLFEAIRLILHHQLIRQMTLAVFIGTFCALWLQQISVRYTSAGVAQTMLAVCPLFAMLIGVIQGRRQPALVWVGLLFGVLGIGLLFFH